MELFPPPHFYDARRKEKFMLIGFHHFLRLEARAYIERHFKLYGRGVNHSLIKENASGVLFRDLFPNAIRSMTMKV